MRVIQLLIFVLVSAAMIEAQTTWTVANSGGIQAAINSATNGDTILVLPGDYHDQVNFNGKAVLLQSTGGAAVTSINGSDLWTCVRFLNGEGPMSILDGFTLKNGLSAQGGGIRVVGASPTIRNCVIQSNRGADAWVLNTPYSQVVSGNPNLGANGGGVSVTNGSPTFTDCVIKWNHAGHGYHLGGSGGGAFISGASSVQWTRCVFLSNHAGDASIISFATSSRGGDGGAVAINGTGTATFTDCRFSSNTAGNGFPTPTPFSNFRTHGGHGGALAIIGAVAINVVGSTFQSNLAGRGGRLSEPVAGSGGSGGAIYARDFAAFSMTDCELLDNLAGDGGFNDTYYGGLGGNGGAVFLRGPTSTFLRCRFLRNHGGNGGFGAVPIGAGFTGASGGSGGTGGLHCECAVTMTNCEITGTIGGQGRDAGFGNIESANGGNGASAGLVIVSTGASKIVGTLIAQNIAGDGGHGSPDNEGEGRGGHGGSAGLIVENGQCHIASTTIADNILGSGAIGYPTNVAAYQGVDGHAGIVAKSCAVTIQDSVVWFNGRVPLTSLNAAATFAVGYTDVEGGAPGTANLAVDPMFRSRPAMDYRLNCGSACLDVGLGQTPGLLAVDLDGESRIQNGVIDLGAYEGVPRTESLAGNTSDLQMTLSVDGPNGNEMAAPCVVAHAGDVVEIVLFSNQGGAIGTHPILAVQPFVTGFAPAGISDVLEVHLDPLSGPIFILLGTPSAPLGEQVLGPSGLTFSGLIPAGLEFLTLRYQSFAFDVNAANGIFQATDARDVVVE